MSTENNLDSGGGSDGGTGGTSDGDTSGGGGGGGGGSPIWSNIAPSWLTDGSSALRAFVSNPQNFIIGAIATTILETVFGVVSTAINQITRLFLGTAPGSFNAPGETLGIADVPFAVVEPLINAGGDAGDAIVTAIGTLNGPVFALAGSAGPLSPVIITAFVVGEVIVAIWLLQRAVFVAADLLQLGGLTE